MGDGEKAPLRLQFNPKVRLEFHGSTITSDAGLLPLRELDEALGYALFPSPGLSGAAGGCPFIPMMLVNFRQDGIITRFRHVIAAVGLNPQVRALRYAEPDMLAISAPNRKGNWDIRTLQQSEQAFGQPAGDATSNALTYPVALYAMGLELDQKGPFESVVVEMRSGQEFVFPIVERTEHDVDRLGQYRAWFLKNLLAKPDHTSDFWNVSSIRLRRRAGEEAFTGVTKLRFWLVTISNVESSSGHFIDLIITINIPPNERDTTAFEVARTLSSADLKNHLQDNGLYYSQAIWHSLDAATLALLLSPYKYGNKPISQIIDPLLYASLYLVYGKCFVPTHSRWFRRNGDIHLQAPQAGSVRGPGPYLCPRGNIAWREWPEEPDR